MKLKDLETWLTPTEVARKHTEQGSPITHQAVIKRLQEGKGPYRAVHTHQGWLIDPASVEKGRDG